MPRTFDAAVVGAGPAGLATALLLARRGFSTVVLDRREPPVDKACGEGLLPAGRRALARLGVLDRISPEASAPFHGIRYVQEDGRAVGARFHDGEGLGCARRVLATALLGAARDAGAELQSGWIRTLRETDAGIALATDAGELHARLVVGCDGLHSTVRRAAGIAAHSSPLQRFGLRAHFALPPWADVVEVHWAAGAEAYVTPVSPGAINVAFLWDRGDERAGWDSLLARFPALRARLAGALPLDEARGAGPLWQAVATRVARRVALVGDAAGYVDAITGQGLSQAFAAAGLLAAALPRDLSPDPRAALARYAAAARAIERAYARPAKALLWLARRPALRRTTLRAAQTFPALFDRAVNAIAG